MSSSDTPTRSAHFFAYSGEAGDYQVEGAKNVQTLNIGGSGTTSVSFVIGT